MARYKGFANLEEIDWQVGVVSAKGNSMQRLKDKLHSQVLSTWADTNASYKFSSYVTQNLTILVMFYCDIGYWEDNVWL